MERVSLQQGGDVDAAEFIAFGVNVLVAGGYVLCSELDDLTHPRSGGGHEADKEVVEVFLIA